ncbi:MAG TPA: enoyl-CoA hydratase/isomerase family protein [Acidimicrobiia bacterium]
MTTPYDALTHLRVAVDAGVAWAVVDHPPLNLWDRELTGDIVGLIGAFEQHDPSRVLVLTSANPDFFIAHADVGMILQMDPSAQGEEGAPAPVNLLLGRLHASPKTSIALVRGIARGGGSEIALSCDLRFASPNAVFAQPEVALGIIPGAGGTQRLTRLVGRARALEIVLGCGDVPADEAAAIGYVNRVIAEDRIEGHVREVATRIATMPPAAVAGAKRAVDAALGDTTAGFVAEASAFRAALADRVAHERMRRFLELGGQTPGVERGDLGELLDRLP